MRLVYNFLLILSNVLIVAGGGHFPIMHYSVISRLQRDFTRSIFIYINIYVGIVLIHRTYNGKVGIGYRKVNQVALLINPPVRIFTDSDFCRAKRIKICQNLLTGKKEVSPLSLLITLKRTNIGIDIEKICYG